MVWKDKIFKKVLIGIFAGFISGMFASGGGMIAVPSLVHLFKMEEKNARATSIFIILPMVVASGVYYLNNNYIDWNISIKCAIGGVVGGYIGAKSLKKLHPMVLKITFTLFLIYVSSKMILGC